MKAKMDELEARKAELEIDLANSEPAHPKRLHPGLSDLYRRKVANLTTALNDPATKPEATTIIVTINAAADQTPFFASASAFRAPTMA